MATASFAYTGGTEVWVVPRHKPGTLVARVRGGRGGWFGCGQSSNVGMGGV